MKILVLGGTAEARQIAGNLTGRDAMFSLAGATVEPKPPGIPMRHGGFGGVAGLARFLGENRFSHVVDATHPFAARMQRNAGLAAAELGIAAIHLVRPAWTTESGDAENARTLAEAARMPLPGSRVFLALGNRHLQEFERRPDLDFVVRTLDASKNQGRFTFISARPPFSVEAEALTFRQHRIDTLVLRNSGGAEGLSKVVAARQLGLRIIMIDRPPAPEGLAVQTVAQVLDWLGKEETKWSDAS